MQKRLHIIFDKPNSILDLGLDDAFIHDKGCCDNIKGGDSIYTFSLMIAAHDERPKIFLDSLFGREDFVRVVENTMYGNFLLQVFSFMQQLSEIVLKREYESVVLYGGSEYVYVSFERSEGEGSPYHYSHSWLFNGLAYQYLKKIGYKVEWKNKKTPFLLEIHNIWRERLLRAKEFQKCVLQYLKNKKCVVGLDEVFIDSLEVLAFAKLEGQANYLSNLLKQIGKPFVIVAPQKFNEDTIALKEFLSIKDIFDNYLKRKKPNILNKNRTISFDYNGCTISFAKSSFKRAISTTYLLYLNAIKRVGNNIAKIGCTNLKYCVTCTAYGRSMLQYTEAIKRIGIKHINMQYVAMGQRNIPIKELANEYYMFEKGALSFYKEKSSIFRFYMPMMPNIEKSLSLKLKPVVVIYTQPDSFTPLYLDLLKQLFLELGKDLDKIKIIIKLHYRQDRENDFKVLASAYGADVVKNEKSVADLMKSSDICVSMTSAILFEATFYKVPAVIYWKEDEVYRYHLDNETGFPYVNYVVRNVSALKNKLLSIDRDDYNRRYNDYLAANNSYSLKQIFE